MPEVMSCFLSHHSLAHNAHEPQVPLVCTLTQCMLYHNTCPWWVALLAVLLLSQGVCVNARCIITRISPLAMLYIYESIKLVCGNIKFLCAEVSKIPTPQLNNQSLSLKILSPCPANGYPRLLHSPLTNTPVYIYLALCGLSEDTVCV